jgi:protein-disulfide isomerase
VVDQSATSTTDIAWQSRLGGLGVVVLAALMVVLDGTRLTGIWPCDIACQGGAHYQKLGGISVIWYGLITHLALLALVWRDVRRGKWCAWSIRLAWLLAGISLFFTAIAWQLQVVCPYCITIHVTTAIIVMMCHPFPRAVRWWQVLSWLMTGLLITNLAFHHKAIPDVTTSTTDPTVTTPDNVALHLAADKGRTYGRPQAAATLEIVIDVTCRHCAELYQPLMLALKPAIADGQVRVIIRHLVRPSQPAGKPASELLFAAAALGEHAVAMDVLLGTNPDASAAGLTSRLADVIDLAKLSPILHEQHAAISTLIADDQQRIQLLSVGPRTPAAALIVDGRVTQRWGGDLPVTAILVALPKTAY